MADSFEALMKAMQKAESDYGGDHRYRHVFSALREARYAAARVQGKTAWEPDPESPGMLAAKAAAEKSSMDQSPESQLAAASGTTSPEGGSSAPAGPVT